MRIEFTAASVRSVHPLEDGGGLSVVTIRGRIDGGELQVELSVRDEQARALAAHYRQESVRVIIVLDPHESLVPDDLGRQDQEKGGAKMRAAKNAAGRGSDRVNTDGST